MKDKTKEKIFIRDLGSKIQDQNAKQYFLNLAICFFYKSRFNKYAHHTSSTISIIALGLIPFFNSLISPDSVPPWTTLLSAISIAAISVSALFKFKESWIRYRNSLEELKNACVIFLRDVHPETEYHLRIEFIEKLQKIAQTENHEWNEAQNSAEIKNNGSGN